MKTFTIKSEISEIQKIEKIVDDVLSSSNIDDNMFGDIMVSVVEAFTNAVVHGNKSDSSKFVHLEIEENELELLIYVKDEGTGFNPDTIPDPTLPQNIEKFNGRGIFLMKNLASDVKFFDNGTKVQLIFSKQS
jgi:serine/threonine-protein kinase RsbW